MLGTVLLIVLVLVLLGGLVPLGAPAPGVWYHGYGYGPGIGGVLGVLLVLLLVLALLGRF